MSETEAREGVTVVNLDNEDTDTESVERKPIAVHLDVDVIDRLKAVKTATKRSVAATIRDLVSDALPALEAEAAAAASDKAAALRAELAALEAIASDGTDSE